MRYALPCASDDRVASKLPDHVRLFCLALSDEKSSRHFRPTRQLLHCDRISSIRRALSGPHFARISDEMLTRRSET